MLNQFVVMESASPFVMSQHIRRCVGNHSIRLVGESGTNDSYLKHLPSKTMSFSVIKYGADVEVTGPPQKNNYQIQLVLRGNCSINHGDHSVELAEGEAAIINPSFESSLVYRNACEKLIITLDAKLVHSRLVQETGIKLSAPLNFDVKVENNRDQGYLIDLIRFYGELSDKQKQNSNFPLVNEMMMDSILSALLKFHSSNYDYLLKDKYQSFPSHLKQALEYIDQHFLHDISTEDMLRRVNVGERILYKSFRDYLNTTPLAYIKALRLKKVREMLVAGKADDIRVTDLALNCGFTHLGRFSKEYKEIYGELPSETLRKYRL